MDKPQNKALERPLALIREKTQEYQELTRINKQSEQLAQYFEELAKNMQDLASGVQGVADTLKNWDYVFRTMALINNPGQSNPTLARLPIIIDQKQQQQQPPSSSNHPDHSNSGATARH